MIILSINQGKGIQEKRPETLNTQFYKIQKGIKKMKSILKYLIILPLVLFNFSCTTAPQDCAGVANGTATVDETRIRLH